ncbi:YfcC family protein [Sediminitomix flava]|uniref:Putative ion transporter superfamily protein YfcC n=1 Tax=Sediminitomix flava TaxID=379075 RepID=A0A315Z7Y1_SEDFL|nr:Na+/H+ antiporter NhaC family protein [Sediminitomix flava]PWJ40967.1 putative ion transporter superfamily protein YfcC [Sediminitomix flava]
MKTPKFPHPLTILTVFVFLAAGLTYLLPSGIYNRSLDPNTGRELVDPTSFHQVEDININFLDALVAIPQGMEKAADIIFLIIVAGGAFMVIEKTGALKAAIDRLVHKFEGKELFAIPVVSLLFFTGGALQNMQEEIIAVVPILVIMTRSLGFSNLVAVAISLGAAAVGASFSPINPFQAVVAQKIAGLPINSAWEFRIAFLLLAYTLWTLGVIYYAKKHPIKKEKVTENTPDDFKWQHGIILGLILSTFVVISIGVTKFDWEFNHITALFLALGVVSGILGRMGVSGTVNAFTEGFNDIASSALLVGVAKAIFVVMDEGQIVDTLVYYLSQPLNGLPAQVTAIGMMGIQSIIHIPVPSVSGQAALTMPLFTPLGDLLGISRQVVVLAYQYGAGLAELILPTNGSLMAILVAAGVNYKTWLNFALKMYGILIGLGVIALVIAIQIGLQ